LLYAQGCNKKPKNTIGRKRACYLGKIISMEADPHYQHLLTLTVKYSIRHKPSSVVKKRRLMEIFKEFAPLLVI
jgi:hypothetical protein